jgi:hypothetical protein
MDNTLMAGRTELNGAVSFEDLFLKKSFFSGETDLDSALISLLHLLDKPYVKTLSSRGFDYLYNQNHLELKAKKSSNPTVKCRFREWKSSKGIIRKKFPTILDFCSAFDVPLDTIRGDFPMRFKNLRLVAHSLRLSWAVYLTLKMFKFGNLRTRQRCRGHQWKFLEKNLLTRIFVHNYKNLEKSPSEQKMIKLLKNSLCYMVSISMDQDEVPEGESYNYLPSDIFATLRKALGKEQFVRFAFSCLQSKVLCQEVPEEFVLEALIKHRNQLSKPHRGIDEATLDLLKSRGRRFGQIVRKYYKPNKGFFPTNKATFEFPRTQGGVKGDLVYNSRFNQQDPPIEDPDDRMEPFVVGLFGQPGMGKSSRINEMVSMFSTLFPNTPRRDLVYQRTCHVDHWDGYKGQPIVIFDDLGQDTSGSDIKEFQTLVSCVPYVLPMAELSEKGIKFQSPIIIATSNLKYGQELRQVYPDPPIIDDASFWRRIHCPIMVEFQQFFKLKETPKWIRQENLMMKKRLPKDSINKISDHLFFQRKVDFDRLGNSQIWESLSDLKSLVTQFKLRKAYHENIRSTWRQTVIDGHTLRNIDEISSLLRDSGLPESTGCPVKPPSPVVGTLEFPAYPPDGPLPVRVEPIKEPLKVRTITAGKGDTFCLKPLQRAMWLALDEDPQFCLTHGTNRLETAIQRIYYESDPEDVWISGDYSAATDSFSIEGSKALLEGILESIDHEPTKRWALKEISPHLLVYPKSSGLEPVLQQSGQLMGSLLSFPLLCLLNDCTAQFAGVPPNKYLINGDDILMRAPPSIYPIWKKKVSEFGLELSAGKNYIHKHWGTVNSQLIFNGDVVGSGKQRVLDRRVAVLGECLRELEIMMPETETEEVHKLFKSVNRAKLACTVRDLEVPISHGGLSFSWGNLDTKSKKSLRTAKLCYIHDLFKRISPKKDHISIPYFSKEKMAISEMEEQMECFLDPVSSKEYHEDFLKSLDLENTRKRCQTHPHLRDLLFEQDLTTLPSLSFLHCLNVPCTDRKIRVQLQKQIDDLFLSNFLQGGIDFGYLEYRELTLKKTMNLQENCQATIKSIFDFCELKFPKDFLRHLNLSFDPRFMDKTKFEEKLFGKGSTTLSLHPKNFDLPENYDDSPDFNRVYLLEKSEEDRKFIEKEWGIPHEFYESQDMTNSFSECPESVSD